MKYTLTLTAVQRARLLPHLFPPDGNEAVAFLLCGRHAGEERTRLLVHKVELLPHELCKVREPDRVTWPTNWLVPLLNEAAKKQLSVIKIHGHVGYDQFSNVDNHSDRELFPSVHAWVGDDIPHGSAILMDDGRVFGRMVDDEGRFHPFDSVNLVGPDLVYWREADDEYEVPESGRRVAQVFGDKTFALLRGLRVAVIGCSGTGSPVIEQLVRNHIGGLVLVDPDHIEEKNLNRIWNSTAADAAAETLKVEVAERTIKAIGFGTKVKVFRQTLFDKEVVRAIADCDVVVGCMDTVDGRWLLNKLATFYLLPYFDLGVRIDADGKGGVKQVAGSVHYLQPGSGSLLSRKVLTLEQVRAAGMQRTNPEEYKRQLKEGYVKGAAVDRPAVIQLNTLIASLAVDDLLARLHPYRLDGNDDSVIRVSLSHNIFQREADGVACAVLTKHVGRGDVHPLLDSPELS